MLNKRNLGIAGVVLSTVFWGMSFIWSRLLMDKLEPLTIVFFRVSMASLILLGASLIAGKLRLIRGKDFKWVMLLAFLQPFLHSILELTAMSYASPTLVALFIATIPILIPIIRFVLWHKRITRNNIVGIVVSTIGVATVIIANPESNFGGSPLGVLFVLLVVATATTYNLVAYRLTATYDPLVITTHQNTISMLLYIPIFFLIDFRGLLGQPFPMETLLPLFYLAFFCSAVAYFLYIYGFKTVGITIPTMLNNFIPVSTAIGAYLLLDERLNAWQIAGILVTVTGLTIGCYPGRKTAVSPGEK